jgi:hypothetical protein
MRPASSGPERLKRSQAGAVEPQDLTVAEILIQATLKFAERTESVVILIGHFLPRESKDSSAAASKQRLSRQPAILSIPQV